MDGPDSARAHQQLCFSFSPKAGLRLLIQGFSQPESPLLIQYGVTWRNSSTATVASAEAMFVVPAARVQRRTEGGAISTPKSGADGQLGEGSSQHDVTTWNFQRLQAVHTETLVGRQWDTRRHDLLWNWPWRLIPGFKSGLKSGCPGGHDDTRACLPPPPSIPCSTNEHGPLPWLHDRTRGDKSHQPQPRELTGPGGEAALSTHVRMRELQHICSSFQELVLSFHRVSPISGMAAGALPTEPPCLPRSHPPWEGCKGQLQGPHFQH